jgi:hypothetical protein
VLLDSADTRCRCLVVVIAEMSRAQSLNEKIKSKSSPSPPTNENEKRYCICQKREDELNEEENDDFMIECDGCKNWFHGKCIKLADRLAGKFTRSICQCSRTLF